MSEGAKVAVGRKGVIGKEVPHVGLAAGMEQGWRREDQAHTGKVALFSFGAPITPRC